jgi:CRISPR-associated protein Cas1
MLYGKIERTLIIAGLDPYVGFLHRDDYNQLSFVYDFIEPYRIHAETVVFRLFSAKKVNQTHTDKITNGYSLNQEGKQLLVTAFNKYVEEDTIRYRGRNQTRSNALQMDAHTFANSLIAPPQEEKVL